MRFGKDWSERFRRDASVAVKWFVAETYFLWRRAFRKQSPAVRAAFDHDGGRKHPGTQAMAGLMSAAEACVYLSLIAALFGGFLAVRRTDRASAQKMPGAIRHPIYDPIYLEAARRLDAQLSRRTRRFIAKIAGTDFARSFDAAFHWRPE